MSTLRVQLQLRPFCPARSVPCHLFQHHLPSQITAFYEIGHVRALMRSGSIFMPQVFHHKVPRQTSRTCSEGHPHLTDLPSQSSVRLRTEHQEPVQKAIPHLTHIAPQDSIHHRAGHQESSQKAHPRPTRLQLQKVNPPPHQTSSTCSETGSSSHTSLYVTSSLRRPQRTRRGFAQECPHQELHPWLLVASHLFHFDVHQVRGCVPQLRVFSSTARKSSHTVFGHKLGSLQHKSINTPPSAASKLA